MLDRKGGGVAPVRVALRDGGEIFIEPERLERQRLGNSAQICRPSLQPLARAALRALRRCFDQVCADQRGDAQILGFDASREIVAPGEEMIHPGGDRIAIATHRCGSEAGAPAIVAQRRHGRFLPRRLILAPPQQQAGERIVAVREAVGFDDDFIASNAFGGKASAVHRGGKAFDHRAHATIAQLQFGLCRVFRFRHADPHA